MAFEKSFFSGVAQTIDDVHAGFSTPQAGAFLPGMLRRAGAESGKSARKQQEENDSFKDSIGGIFCQLPVFCWGKGVFRLFCRAFGTKKGRLL
ncbi:hypothetical protein [uncultured Mailhella sp.]|uniref:hypothetical protein n=1 Tax=uncultured Mailhella sp. TaxID=1981031 RepID=UPI0025F0C46A|nr:hypothetical protein [uncultured Mailhella sp.]